MKATMLYKILIVFLVFTSIMAVTTGVSAEKPPSMATRSFKTGKSLVDCVKAAQAALKAEGYTGGLHVDKKYVHGNRKEYKSLIFVWSICNNSQRLVVVIVSGPAGNGRICGGEAARIRDTMENKLK